MPTLHVVIQTIGGFAREDAPRAQCVGIYTDPVVANQVKALAGVDASVQSVEIDYVPPGFLESARQLGFEVGKPRKSSPA